MTLVYTKLDAFFDRSKVQRAMDRKTARVLGGTGAAARTHIRRSMRPATKGKYKNIIEGGQAGVFRDDRGRLRDAAGAFISKERAAAMGIRQDAEMVRVFESGGSKPGKPPRYHTKLLRDGIFFNYDRNTQSVIVGPRLLGGHKPTGRSNRRTIPELLEFGGVVRVKRKTFKYRPRPYIEPAVPYAAAVMAKKMKTIPIQ